MRLSVTIFVALVLICIVHASLLEPVIENVVHIKASASPNGAPGIWRKKTIWKPRWVKEWKSAKVMKPTYKKVWSPVLVKEWIPFPKPPAEWDSKSAPQKSIGPEHNEQTPMWDPMPYPESQQPPPSGPTNPNQSHQPPSSVGGSFHHDEQNGYGRTPGPHNGAGKQGGSFHHGRPGGAFHHGSQGGSGGSVGTFHYGGREPDGPGGPFHHGGPRGSDGLYSNGNSHCHHQGGCRTDVSVQTFTQEQIAEIIGHTRYKKATDHSANGEYPESNQTTSENWRSRRQSSFGLNLLQELSQFLVPPRFLGFNYQEKATHPPPPMPPKRPNRYKQQTRQPNNSQQNKFHQSPPASNHNQRRPMEQYHKFQNSHSHIKNQFSNENGYKKGEWNKSQTNPPYSSGNKPNPHGNPNVIQPAELVNEYHYSEFDISHPINSKQPLQEIKFKPLPPSMWFPPINESKTEENKQSIQAQLNINGKPRPIRKDIVQLTNHLQSHHELVTSSHPPFQTATTPATFDQEKAITKEIIPIFDATPNPIPANHRFEPAMQHKANATNDGVKKVENSQTKAPIRLSEEVLLNALIRNPIKQRTTTPECVPETSSSSDDTSSPATTSTTTAKSPVFIVTPIYQSPTL